MNNDHYCVIMAGGIGSRFWPLSRTSMPKQFLDILGVGKTLLQQTFDRFKKICPVENIFIVTNLKYTELVQEQLPEITPEQILGEPIRRNTAPCIAYANSKILKRNPNARVIVSPSDHLILNEEEFLRVAKKSLDFVEKNTALVTLGIKPSRPETNYGYIQIEQETTKFDPDGEIVKAKIFTEKPPLKLAKIFLKSGDFFWNSGMFIWKLEDILNAFDEHLPDISNLFSEGMKYLDTDKEEAFIKKQFPACNNISIDYGIMEKDQKVFVLCSDFGWSDLGTWGSLYEVTKKGDDNNALLSKDIFHYDTQDSLIRVPKDKVAIIQGLKDYIVVDTEDVLLICHKDDDDAIRMYSNTVQLSKGDKYV